VSKSALTDCINRTSFSPRPSAPLKLNAVVEEAHLYLRRKLFCLSFVLQIIFFLYQFMFISICILSRHTLWITLHLHLCIIKPGTQKYSLCVSMMTRVSRTTAWYGDSTVGVTVTKPILLRSMFNNKVQRVIENW